MVIVGKVFLIRHGEKSNDGKSLTEIGKRQMNYLAKRLTKMEIDKVYFSDIPRCKRSAEIVAKILGKRIIYDKSLREVESDVFHYPEKHPMEVDKIVKFSETIKSVKGNILVVSSGNVNRILISNLWGIDQTKFRTVQIPSCINELWVSDSKKVKVFSLNDTKHLPESLVRRQADRVWRSK